MDNKIERYRFLCDFETNLEKQLKVLREEKAELQETLRIYTVWDTHKHETVFRDKSRNACVMWLNAKDANQRNTNEDEFSLPGTPYGFVDFRIYKLYPGDDGYKEFPHGL